MKITIVCEGKTEKALKDALLSLIERQRQEADSNVNRVRIEFRKQDGAVPSGDKLKRLVENILHDSQVIAVIILKDMFPEYKGVSSEDARASIRADCGNNPKVFAHVAKHDVEAWLLAYWDVITKRLNSDHKLFGSNPEDVNDENPPAHRLKELYRIAKPRPKNYSKPIEAAAILRDRDLSIAANQCRELKLFLNTILRLCQLPELP